MSLNLAGGRGGGQARFGRARAATPTWQTSGDARSLMIHTVSTIHRQFSPEQQVGTEHIDDILADLEAGFRTAKEATGAAAASSKLLELPESG